MSPPAFRNDSVNHFKAFSSLDLGGLQLLQLVLFFEFCKYVSINEGYLQRFLRIPPSLGAQMDPLEKSLLAGLNTAHLERFIKEAYIYFSRLNMINGNYLVFQFQVYRPSWARLYQHSVRSAPVRPTHPVSWVAPVRFLCKFFFHPCLQ